jgi:hypothetical protein
MAVQTQIQTRRGTAASWTSTNPTLAAGEIGFESDTGKFKIGNGSTAWAALAYASNVSPLTTKGDLYTYSTDNTRLAIGNNGESLVADSSTSTGLRYQGNFAAGKNKIINGDFGVWQRGTSFTANGYGPDRFYCYRAVAGATYTRQTTSDTTNLPDIKYALRIQRNSGNADTTNIAVGQSFENDSSTPFVGRTITLSFFARKGTDANAIGLSASVLSGTGTNQNEILSFTGRVTVANTAPSTTSTWTRYSVTGTVPTSATQIAVRFTKASTGTAGADDWYEITGVQLEAGSVATAFQTATGTIQGELAACQRYYWRWTANATYSMAFGAGAFYTTSQAKFMAPSPIMRTAPSSIDYSSGLRLTDWTNFSDVTTLTLIASTELSNPGAFIAAAGASFANYRPAFITASNNASAYIGFSAEL